DPDFSQDRIETGEPGGHCSLSFERRVEPPGARGERKMTCSSQGTADTSFLARPSKYLLAAVRNSVTAPAEFQSPGHRRSLRLKFPWEYLGEYLLVTCSTAGMLNRAMVSLWPAALRRFAFLQDP